MKIISSNIYNLIDGEPHLGKQEEIVVSVDREEYIEGLIAAFSNGCTEPSDEFELENKELEIIQSYTLDSSLTEPEIEEILRQMDQNLLDDDYGTQKETDLLYNLIDSYIDDNWKDEFEIIKII